MFMNVPGLKIITPAYPSDAKGLLRSAVDSDDPVLIFEACILWGSKEDVDENEYKIPAGGRPDAPQRQRRDRDRRVRRRAGSGRRGRSA
jgi:hypothetical protein